MEHIEDVKGECALWLCEGQWEETELEELDMSCRASGCIVAGTELDIDCVDTREINDDNVFLDRTGART